MDNATALAYFERWFVKPINTLKDLDSGDGGWVALITAMALYQRLLVARLKLEGKGTSDDEVGREVERDLDLTEMQRKIFWDMFRNGLMHAAMPKAGKTKWRFRDDYTAYPQFTFEDTGEVICIHPIKFAERVTNEFKANPTLILSSGSFPWAMVEA